MVEIKRSLDQQGQLPLRYTNALEHLARELLRERCLIFLGAGASIDQQKASLPSGRELSRAVAEKCRLDWHDYIPLSTIAFYYELFFSRSDLNSFLQERIDSPQIEPSTTIERLIEIIKVLESKNKNILVVTTNYDQHFERAYRRAFQREPGVVIYKGAWDPNDEITDLHYGLDGDSPEFWEPKEQTCLYKMHGCISQPDGQNLVITEEDYINFLSNALSNKDKKRLPLYIRRQMALSTILFVGYSLSDWNFRVIFKGTAEARPQKTTVSYADQCHTSSARDEDRWNALVEFWGRKYVNIINADGAQFMEDLLGVVQVATGSS